MRVYKYYVDVETMIRADGSLDPVAMFWKGHRYEVDKVIKIRETFCKAGGCGVRYTCRFGSDERNLFWERNRWFLESEVYEPTMLENNKIS